MFSSGVSTSAMIRSSNSGASVVDGMVVFVFGGAIDLIDVSPFDGFVPSEFSGSDTIAGFTPVAGVEMFKR